MNVGGQLGDGTTVNRASPVLVVGEGGAGTFGGAVDVYVSGTNSCAALADRTGYCWGFNAAGQLTDGTEDPGLTPVLLRETEAGPALSFDEIAGGTQFLCARRTGVPLRCWGWNFMGMLGDGSMDDHAFPLRLTTPAAP
jgi:serine/threonine-protein kinase